MLLIIEGGAKIDNPMKEQVAEELDLLDGVDKTFLILENNKGNYIQVGGGADEFTVEVRIYSSAEDFRHWKAEKKDVNSAELKMLYIGGMDVRVIERQVLDIYMVQRLFESFLDGELLCECVQWSDMTAMFK